MAKGNSPFPLNNTPPSSNKTKAGTNPFTKKPANDAIKSAAFRKMQKKNVLSPMNGSKAGHMVNAPSKGGHPGLNSPGEKQGSNNNVASPVGKLSGHAKQGGQAGFQQNIPAILRRFSKKGALASQDGKGRFAKPTTKGIQAPGRRSKLAPK